MNLSRRQFLECAVGALAASYCLPGVAAETPLSRPNIVFVCTDDQATWTLGSSGNGDAHTPHLDRFFAESLRLDNAFVVTPVCSPSRASTVSGRYGTEVGITDWIKPETEPNLGLAKHFTIWPEVLQANGYQTALIGKWHLGTQDEFHPTKRGFDRFVGFREGGAKPIDPVLEIDGVNTPVKGITDNVLCDYAIEQLKKFDRTKPFLLDVQFRWPHTPWQPLPDEDWAPYKDLDPKVPNPDFPDLDVENVKARMKEYLAACTGVDNNMNRLLAALDESGLAENTIVVFTSDHGYNVGHHGIWHKGNGRKITMDVRGLSPEDPRINRPNMFDTSLRVPVAIRWPKVLTAGARVSQNITNLDWFPTLVAMAGLTMPDGLKQHGRNALPLLKGESIPWEQDFYAQYSQHHSAEADMRMYRTPEWKLMRDFRNAGKDELYHLAVDPDEMTNLIDEPAAQAMRETLNEKLLAYMKSIDDPLLKNVA